MRPYLFCVNFQFLADEEVAEGSPPGPIGRITRSSSCHACQDRMVLQGALRGVAFQSRREKHGHWEMGYGSHGSMCVAENVTPPMPSWHPKSI